MNNRLRQLRLQKGLSQENIAFELGISQKSYSNIENGKTELKLNIISQLAKILETSPYKICPNSKHCNCNLYTK